MQASASARGYGRSHQKLAAQLLNAWQPGDPCARCGQPMWQRWRIRSDGQQVSAIHLGHTPDRTGYTGLEHDTCNLADGARRGNQARGRRRRAVKAGTVPAWVPLTTSRNW